MGPEMTAVLPAGYFAGTDKPEVHGNIDQKFNAELCGTVAKKLVDPAEFFPPAAVELVGISYQSRKVVWRRHMSRIRL
ncbi:MAG: hypothetical protein R3311_20230, partial [Oceanisphaera sp.]|nr:hypothetical protein [Oceanisphaera sp.]